MKKHIIILFAPLVFLLNSCFTDYTSTDYLKTVLGNLEKIESASYDAIGEHWNLGDTTPTFTMQKYFNEYDNPSDSTIGSNFVVLDPENKTTATTCYDGQMVAKINHDKKLVIIDSFTVSKLPFRTLTPPFFSRSKNIIKYALSTNDSISLDIDDQKDVVHLTLTIYEEEEIAFFGKAAHIPRNANSPEENNTIYELWIDKSANLPYKIRRVRPFYSSVTMCKNYELNNLDIEQFSAADYIPEDYEIRQYGVKPVQRSPHDLVGKVAPDWTLQTTDQLPVSLTDLKSKVLLIQFTSVTCGPCRASIPFLKKLSTRYTKDEFDVVAIEVTSRNSDVLTGYKNRNDINYNFLQSTETVVKDYSISSFPVFFILDKNREIKHVLKGYGKGTSDREIISLINDLV